MSDDPGAVYEHFGIPAQPALVVVDAAGDVQTLFGAADEATVDGLLDGLTGG